MTITVIYDPEAVENRKYSGICTSCKREMSWVRADAKTVVAADGITPAHSTIDCPADGNEVVGRLM